MALVINSNVLSLTAQRNLTTSQSQMATSLQRLSSGLRINSAKDDAAGLAISNRFTTQIRGLNQAARNASDGISLSQVGESALGEVTNNLQRIRELAVQAANSTNSASDRAALDLEVQQRLEEIERIATQTSFNGQKVLDGTFGGATFQVGANVGETIGLNLGTDASMRRTDIGAVATATTVDLGTLIVEEADAVATTSVASGTFTSATLASGEDFSLTVGGVTVFSRTAAGAETIDATALDGDAVGGATGGLGNSTVQSNLAAAGITYTGDFSSGITFTKADGTDLAVAVVNDGTGGTFSATTFVGTHTNGTEAVVADPLTTASLTITIGEGDPLAVADGDYETAQDFVDAVNTALAGEATATYDSDTGIMSIVSGETITIGGGTGVFSAASFAAAGSIDTVNVLNLAGANDAISRIDAALTSVSTLRSTFGAIQNRFESTISNLQAVSENLEASRSRILDADFAAETASLTKAQILQQAGIAILSQANAAPQSVLALLQ